jgi:hypothetical protein
MQKVILVTLLYFLIFHHDSAFVLSNLKLNRMSYLLYAETLRKTSFIDQSFVIRDDVAKLILGQRTAYPGDYLVHENV